MKLWLSIALLIQAWPSAAQMAPRAHKGRVNPVSTGITKPSTRLSPASRLHILRASGLQGLISSPALTGPENIVPSVTPESIIPTGIDGVPAAFSGLSGKPSAPPGEQDSQNVLDTAFTPVPKSLSAPAKDADPGALKEESDQDWARRIGESPHALSDAGASARSVSGRVSASAAPASGLQREFEAFLAQDGRLPLEVPAPKIEDIASELLRKIGKSRLGLNRYSFERNHYFGRRSIVAMISWVAHWGLDFMQIHIGSFEGMSDDEIRGAAAAARQYGLEIQLDVSSTREEDLDVFRIADLMAAVQPVGMIRTYIRESGRVTDMTSAAIKSLRSAMKEAARRNIPLVLEQHEVLTGSEFREVLEAVGGKLGALFDFGNPVTAGERPEAVLRRIRGLVRMTHIKDVLTLPSGNGGQHQYGVKLGEGDINVIEMIFEALLHGADLSLQSVVGYHAFAARDDSTGPDTEFSRRPPSETYVSGKILRSPSRLRETLETEVLDAQEQLSYIRWVRDRLEDFALRALGLAGLPGISPMPPASRQSSEIRLARRIEAIGRRLFPDDPKSIWPQGPKLTPATWRKIHARNPGMKRTQARKLLARADRLKRRLSPPLYDRDRSELGK